MATTNTDEEMPCLEKTSHWGEVYAASNTTDCKSIASVSTLKSLGNLPPSSSLSIANSVNKFGLSNSDTLIRKEIFDLDSVIDRNLVSSVKLIEKLSSSGGASITGDAAFIIADFSENSELNYTRPLKPLTEVASVDNPRDARLLLTKSLSIILMHNEIFQCKRSVLECLVDAAEKFIKNLGIQLSSAVSFGSTCSNETALMEEAEIALHNVGVNGIADVLQYYRCNVLHKHMFVEASVNRLLSKTEK